MILVSYDIANDKLRTSFSKYLEKYGHRLQCSVFEVRNSQYVLDNIISDIKNKFEKRFKETDSVLIFNMGESCKIERFGHSSHDDEDVLFVF